MVTTLPFPARALSSRSSRSRAFSLAVFCRARNARCRSAFDLGKSASPLELDVQGPEVGPKLGGFRGIFHRALTSRADRYPFPPS